MNINILPNLIASVCDIINRTLSSKEDKEQAKSELSEEIIRHYDELYQIQKEIITTETKGNRLQRSWRPIVMLAFSAVVILGVFTDIPMLNNDSPFWTLLQIGMGGYVIGRSAEKISDKFTKKHK